MKYFLLPLFFAAVFFSCTAPKSNNKEEYTILAEKKFKNDFSVLFSPDKNFVLCAKNPDKANLNADSENGYFIYDIKNKALIHEENLLRGGSYRWADAQTVEITPRKEYNAKTTGDLPKSYFFDVVEKKQVKKTSANEK
jgi:hypothetical protein